MVVRAIDHSWLIQVTYDATLLQWTTGGKKRQIESTGNLRPKG
jgi:hypothetical protein